jgi:hypothetical protein
VGGYQDIDVSACFLFNKIYSNLFELKLVGG